MRVTVLDRKAQERLWGSGYRSIRQVIKTVEIGDACPVCGGHRGEPERRHFHEDGEDYGVDTWKNPCGHLDSYESVILEAASLQAAAAGE